MNLKFYFTMLIVFVLYAYVSNMDFQDQAALACEQHGGEWSGEFCKITVKDHCK